MNLLAPYCGKLVDLLVPDHQLDDAKRHANSLPSIQISERTLCDLECLAVGAFSPLDRFMGQADYESVLDSLRLSTGEIENSRNGEMDRDPRFAIRDPSSPQPPLFPIPITLPLPDDLQVSNGDELALRDSKNNLLAWMEIEEIYEWDHDEEAEKVYGTLDPRHPLVAEMHRWGERNASGPLHVLQLPVHHDFNDLRLTPKQTRRALEELVGEMEKWRNREMEGGGRNVERDPRSAIRDSRSAQRDPQSVPVVAFQTRNPLHRVHEELIRRAMEETGGVLLLHPVVGLTKTGDIDHYTRVRTYRALARYFDSGRSLLSLLPMAMRFAGPREALWHAIVRRNYGADHLIVGRGHASPFRDSEGEYFHELYEAQDLVRKHQEELGVTPICFRELVYDPASKRYEERIADRGSRIASEAAPGDAEGSKSQGSKSQGSKSQGSKSQGSKSQILKSEIPKSQVSGGEERATRSAPTRQRDAAQSGVSFSSRHFKEQYLDQDRPIPPWFAREEVAEILRESHPPKVRQGVCIWFTGLSGSGKSTIAEVLTILLAEHGRQVTLLDGDVVRTHLSKGLGFSKEDRDINIRRIGYVAAEIARHGGTVVCAAISPYRSTRNDVRNLVGTDNFVEVFVDTPLEVCEDRDIKGLYAKARRGEIKGFTGIDDPYEEPEHPEVTLGTVQNTPETNAGQVVEYLRQAGFVAGEDA